MRSLHWPCAALAVTLIAAQARANLIINATFDSSITSDSNASQIEGAINTAIGFYEASVATNIDVPITFQEGGGLGGSSFSLFTLSYSSFYSDLLGTSSGNLTDTTAYNNLALDGNPANTGGKNPVTGASTVNIKPADMLALGFTPAQLNALGWDGSGGAITLNTSLTTPGSPGSSLSYNLVAVTEHEIDEILGLGSTLGLTFSGGDRGLANNPSPEDFFRFDASGNRSYTLNSANAYFSLDGSTDLAQFNNPTVAGCKPNCGDYGDWQSNPLPSGVMPQVQDAFATPGSNPSLVINSPEVVALDAIGYTLVTPVTAPEPASVYLSCAGMLLLAGVARRRATAKAPASL